MSNAHHQITKISENEFEAYHYGCIIGVFPTEQEAQEALNNEDSDDKIFGEMSDSELCVARDSQ